MEERKSGKVNYHSAVSVTYTKVKYNSATEAGVDEFG